MESRAMEPKLSLEDARLITSEAQTRKMKYEKEGMDGPSAYARANGELSHEWGIPDVGSEAGRAFRWHQISTATVAEEPRQTKKRARRAQSERTFKELYTEWCSTHDWVPHDDILAAFCGCTPNAFYYARRKMVHTHDFKPTDHGYAITKRKPKTFTQDEVNRAINETLRQLGIIQP